MDIDSGRLILANLCEQYGNLLLHDANEATTRRVAIDAVITNVLGWLPDDITYEERVSEDDETEFADYIIRTASTGIVIEAKRAGASFQLPNNRRSGKLNGFLAEGEVGEAIRQARDYARKLSLPFAVVTNGNAWVIFAATRLDGIPFEEGQAHIFRSLGDAKDRIVEFWELLSRQRVIEGNLDDHFFGPPKPDDQYRLVNSIRDASFKLGRNQLFPSIERELNAAFSDEVILHDAEALRHCYVKNSSRVKYDDILRLHIADAKPRLDRKASRPLASKGDTKTIDEHISRTAISLPQLMLLLGPVGAGKTTFLHYTQKVSAANAIDGKVIWIYIDFKLATPTDDPRTFLFQRILDFIETDTSFDLGDWGKVVKHAYKQELANLKKGPLAMVDEATFNQRVSEIVMAERIKVEPYIGKILTYSGRLHPIYLVIDNVDQLDNEEYCGKIFIEAQAAARRIGANVIMTMRDTTYGRYRSTAIFDAFQLDAVYVDAPSVLPVISRRFAYAKRMLQGKKATFVADNGSRFVIDDLGAFCDVIIKSVLENPCAYMVEVLSAGNVRRGLALVKEFLASAHVSSDRALYDYAGGNPSFIPPHEFFKGAVFGQRKFYREEDSLLLNLFDAKIGGRAFQMLRIHLLELLCASASASDASGVEVTQIINELYKMGLPDQEVMHCLNTLHRGGLIRTTEGFDELPPSASLLPTRLGGYLLRELSGEFTYLEACALDAYIYDRETWDALREITEQVESKTGMARLELRIKRVETFLEYCSAIERNWLIDISRFRVGLFSAGKTVADSIVPKAGSSFEFVKRSAKKAFSRKVERLRFLNSGV